MIDAENIVEQLRQKAREHRQQARRLDAAIKVLLEPSNAQGRPVKPNSDLYEAFRKSGLTYKQIAAEVGVGYMYVSWVIRGHDDKPELDRRIREVLTLHSEGKRDPR